MLTNGWGNPPCHSIGQSISLLLTRTSCQTPVHWICVGNCHARLTSASAHPSVITSPASVLLLRFYPLPPPWSPFSSISFSSLNPSVQQRQSGLKSGGRRSR